jgi:hypothetical protein
MSVGDWGRRPQETKRGQEVNRGVARWFMTKAGAVLASPDGCAEPARVSVLRPRESAVTGQDGCLRARVHAEFLEDSRQGIAHRFLADEQCGPDLRIALS